MDTPDLQSILANLARYTAPAQPAQASYDSYNNGKPNMPGPGYPQTAQTAPTVPDHGAPTLPGLGQFGSTSQALADRTEDPRLRPQSRSTTTASPKPVIDPATITTWKDGLRCAQKLAEQNRQFAASIRKVIKDQENHEHRWYSERQELKLTQAKRASSSAQAQSILQSLSATTSSSASGQTEIDNETELAAFDRKIYSAQRAMETAMIAELKGLGVPFFGTDQDLIVPDGSEEATDQLSGNQPKWSPKISETQLMALRRKMVQYLEDSYKD